jgi:3-oxoacyl-[acyl-carrier-protein] synthase-3
MAYRSSNNCRRGDLTYSKIIGTGSYLPVKTVTNYDLEKIIDTTHDWIFSRSGILERHFAADDQKSSDLAYEASIKAIEAAGISASDIDLIVVATTSPDMPFPSTACILQKKLGISNGSPAFDLQAVCGGFIFALNTADLYVRSGQAKTALVVGAEVMSRMLDWNDRTTCVLFGDGAGAVVLKASDEPGIIASKLHSDGSYRDLLKADPKISMEGQAVFKFAVNSLSGVVEELLEQENMTGSDIDWMVPHQANIRIIEATAKKLGMTLDNVVVTVANHGNTSAASIPLALDTAVRDGRIKPGQTVIMEAIGGGFTWGATLIKW